MLHIDSISFAYNKEHILFNDISYTLQDNTFYCLIGMNGTGKSTFAKLLVGILSPSTGKITYNDKNISTVNIGYLQQNFLLNPSILTTVFDFVLMGCIKPKTLFFSKEDKEKTAAVLEQCNLIDKKKALIHQISGGQFQRALIARVLVSNPDFIVFDEPFVALDVQAREEVLLLMEALKGNRTIVLITHDAEVIERIADKVVCISNDDAHHSFVEYFLENKNIHVDHICNIH